MGGWKDGYRRRMLFAATVGGHNRAEKRKNALELVLASVVVVAVSGPKRHCIKFGRSRGNRSVLFFPDPIVLAHSGRRCLCRPSPHGVPYLSNLACLWKLKGLVLFSMDPMPLCGLGAVYYFTSLERSFFGPVHTYGP